MAHVCPSYRPSAVDAGDPAVRLGSLTLYLCAKHANPVSVTINAARARLNNQRTWRGAEDPRVPLGRHVGGPPARLPEAHEGPLATLTPRIADAGLGRVLLRLAPDQHVRMLPLAFYR